ncbi:ABC transporter ATP-binding protein [Pseudacidovorax intermedius]|uniref:ABC transporter ATP-binding protein n=1 Tax=Pseudacidovorax intermedius TaxID=433924 RepID=UPI0026EEA41D|nr:ABC transporter ATP-binding protein [Pseudacidovorax intermedius]
MTRGRQGRGDPFPGQDADAGQAGHAAFDAAPVLQVDDLHARLGGAPVLHGVTLRLQVGRWTSIVGPNGAGKSTLLKAMAGLLAPSGGEVLLDGEGLSTWPHRARARRLAWLAQGGAADPAADDLTAYDVAMLGRLPHQRWLAAPSNADHAAVEQALRQTQAWDWRGRPLSQLSGGERQRVLLARALAVEAGVLLMDEPLANLDPPHQADCLALARTLAEAGRTVVTVLHELHAALAADDLAVMAGGRLLHHGPCGDSATHAAVEAVFDHRIRIRRVDDQWVALHR